ncbi:MAG: hypothetical protein GC149_01760 [Gammaproteobacteria bacterium]|nr:hypothetical protein [Gammaproteobacteria bacterium]
MKGKVLVILAASVLAFPVFAAGPQQPSRQPYGPSWNWDPNVVGEKFVYRYRHQTANQYQEQNTATDTEQNRFRENNANQQQLPADGANNLGW